MKTYAIIVAGGSGLRMGAALPKQFLELDGKPILQHTLERIASFHTNTDLEIILALPESHIQFWNSLCQKHNCTVPHQITLGGETRFHSVQNALKQVTEKSLVAIHDGVRPLVSEQTWNNCLAAAQEKAAVVPVMEMTESVRQITPEGSQSVNRAQYRLVQTPQTFQSTLILKAYQQAFQNHFTDDASVIEFLGESVFLTEGNVENIKITRHSDLGIASILLAQA